MYLPRAFCLNEGHHDGQVVCATAHFGKAFKIFDILTSSLEKKIKD
jgi:hypothetical protein